MEAATGGLDEKSKSTFTVLVTGANSGLGFALCCRLIDEFLCTRPQSQTLHLLFSTRDTAKSEATLLRLNSHFQRTLRDANAKTLGISRLLEPRIKLEGVKLDLLKLSTAKALAEELLRRDDIETLDAVVWNAGIAGWKGQNWPKAIWSVCTDLVHATTWPMYMICDVGLLAKPQLTTHSHSHSPSQTTTPPPPPLEEPKLGQVFLANVFGHYMLTHYLSTLFHSDTRILWTSSISASEHTFSVNDIQGLQAEMAYESSKRLTDVLVLSSELPSTRPYVDSFLPATSPSPAAASSSSSSSQQQQWTQSQSSSRRPRMYTIHPGVCGTSIAGLNWFVSLFMTLSFYLARWLGSPWHPVTPYKGAVSAAFTLLSSQIPEMEQEEGKGKWGSATGVFGDERVARTEVDGWGYCGRLGVVPKGSVVMGGGYRGRRELTQERREEFEEVGRRVWREMEEMRGEWERRLGPIVQGTEKLVDV